MHISPELIIWTEEMAEHKKTTATITRGRALTQNEVGPLRNLDKAVTGHILIKQMREAWLFANRSVVGVEEKRKQSASAIAKRYQRKQ